MSRTEAATELGICQLATQKASELPFAVLKKGGILQQFLTNIDFFLMASTA